MNSTTAPATDQDLRNTIRHMLADWDAASEEDRAAALAAAKAAADSVCDYVVNTDCPHGT